MTLSLNCKGSLYGETEEELFANENKHAVEAHGYMEDT